MLTKVARRVASRWAYAWAAGDYSPKIPQEYIARCAFAPSDPDFEAITNAQDSVNVFLPKFIELLRKTQGDRYYANTTEGGGRLVYFFAPRQPIDTFGLMLSIKGGKAVMTLSYMPYNLQGNIDFKKSRSEKVVSEPEMAGLAFMRLARKLLQKLTSPS